jgi:hypothetical protein
LNKTGSAAAHLQLAECFSCRGAFSQSIDCFDRVWETGKRQGSPHLMLAGLLGLARNTGYLGQQGSSFSYRQQATQVALSGCISGLWEKIPDELLLASILDGDLDSKSSIAHLTRLAEFADDSAIRGEAWLSISQCGGTGSVAALRNSFRCFEHSGRLARSLTPLKLLIEKRLASGSWSEVLDTIQLAIETAEAIHLDAEINELTAVARRWRRMLALREGNPAWN